MACISVAHAWLKVSGCKCTELMFGCVASSRTLLKRKKQLMQDIVSTDVTVCLMPFVLRTHVLLGRLQCCGSTRS